MNRQQDETRDAFRSQLDEIQHAESELLRNRPNHPGSPGSSHDHSSQGPRQVVPAIRVIQDIWRQQPAPGSSKSSTRDSPIQQRVATSVSSFVNDSRSQQLATSTSNSPRRNIWGQQGIATSGSSFVNDSRSQQLATSSSSSPRRNIWGQQGIATSSTSFVNNDTGQQHLGYDHRGHMQAVGVQDRFGRPPPPSSIELRRDCDRCIDKRIVCSSGRPSCSYCSARGLQCHYSPLPM